MPVVGGSAAAVAMLALAASKLRLKPSGSATVARIAETLSLKVPAMRDQVEAGSTGT